MPTVTIKDISLLGPQSPWQLDIDEEQSTLRAVIRSRIYQEVSEYNARRRNQFSGLIPPASHCPESADAAPTLDWQVHYEQAIKAFEQKRYVVLIDERQATKLDHPIHLTAYSTVTFLKLIPLIGG
jgi:hypothetical protein